MVRSTGGKARGVKDGSKPFAGNEWTEAKTERMTPTKKLVALFLCLCLMAGIVPVVAENTAVTHEITSANYPFHLGATALGEVPLYFLDGANDMPYIDAESMHMLCLTKDFL